MTGETKVIRVESDQNQEGQEWTIKVARIPPHFRATQPPCEVPADVQEAVAVWLDSAESTHNQEVAEGIKP